MNPLTFADAVRPPRQLKPLGLAFDGEGMEVRTYQDGESVLYQAFCVCGNRQITPGSKSAANRWRKIHRRSCLNPSAPQLVEEQAIGPYGSPCW